MECSLPVLCVSKYLLRITLFYSGLYSIILYIYIIIFLKSPKKQVETIKDNQSKFSENILLTEQVFKNLFSIKKLPKHVFK